jgi:hypothetical protein
MTVPNWVLHQATARNERLKLMKLLQRCNSTKKPTCIRVSYTTSGVGRLSVHYDGSQERQVRKLVKSLRSSTMVFGMVFPPSTNVRVVAFYRDGTRKTLKF